MNIMASIDGTTQIAKDEIIGFKISHSLNQIAPKGYILIDDRRRLFREGKILVGSRVQIYTDDKNAKNFLFDMYISSISIPSADPSTFDGNIMCYLDHPIMIFQCVPPTANIWSNPTANEVIEKIINDNKTYKELNFIKDIKLDPCEKFNHLVTQSYQCGMDFIKDEIIPYISIEDFPALFYINYHKDIYLTTMKKLWVEDPKFTIGTSSALNAIRDLQYTAQTDKKLLLNTIGFGLSPDGSLLRNFRVGFTIPDQTTDASISGNAKPYVKIDEAGILPISVKAAELIGDNITRSILCSGRNTNDCITLVLNEQKCVYDAIYANATALSYDEDLDVGQVVYLATEDASEKGHFLEGQYLIFECGAELTNEPGVIRTKLVLIKPGLSDAHSHLSSDALANFYKVV